jgi:FKBP-type peptidyl-prolyl cis-trans isomerase FkpA
VAAFPRLGALVLFAILPANACGGTQFPRDTHVNNARTGDAWLEGDACPEPIVTDTAVHLQDVELGTGSQVQAGDTVRVHYLASLPSGVKIRDSRDSGAPVELVVGSAKTMCGFDYALAGMRAGGQRRVTIPSRFAWGPSRWPADVPPESAVVFTIDLYLPAEDVIERHAAPVNPARGRRR